MRTIFHITKPDAWAAAQKAGRFEAASLATEGFIHFSRPHQLLATARRHYDGVEGLVLLQVSEEKVTAPVKYEGADGNKFPHVYGALNLEAVVAVEPLSLSASGFALSEKWRLVGDTLIRAGQPGDEAEITSVHTHAWQQSYQGIVPESFLRERPLSFRSRLAWWRGVTEGRDPWSVHVAESAQHGIIGFCGYGPGREAAWSEAGEIGAIYCLNEYKGKGIGATLFREAQRQLRRDGFKKSYLWVLKDNPSIEFYRRVGGRELPNRKSVEFSGQALEEIAFEWNL